MLVKIGGLPGVSKLYKGWSEGILRNGDLYHLMNLDNPMLNDMDCFYQFNVYNPIQKYKKYHRDGFLYILNSKKPFLVREEGSFRQYQDYKKFGWWSYRNDIGIFNNLNADDARWKKFLSRTGLKIKDWQKKGTNIVIMGQVNADSAMITLFEKGFNSFYHWTVETIKEIRKYTDRPILIRPHPKEKDVFDNISKDLINFKNITVSNNFFNQDPLLNHGGGGLYEDLNSAYCVVTFNSNSAVEALCEGIPIFALDSGSAAFDVSHNDLSKIENLNYNIDISNWCNKIAYTMWTKHEVSTGEMWAHLKPVYFN